MFCYYDGLCSFVYWFVYASTCLRSYDWKPSVDAPTFAGSDSIPHSFPGGRNGMSNLYRYPFSGTYTKTPVYSGSNLPQFMESMDHIIWGFRMDTNNLFS